VATRGFEPAQLHDIITAQLIIAIRGVEQESSFLAKSHTVFQQGPSYHYTIQLILRKELTSICHLKSTKIAKMVSH
jgi:hypothetical protein